MLTLAILALIGCRPEEADCSECDPVEETADTAEEVDPLGYEVVDVAWSLGEVPTWDPLLVYKEGEYRDYEACFMLTANGRITLWDSVSGELVNDDTTGSWSRTDANHFRVFWPDPRDSDDAEDPANDLDAIEQTWTWLPEQVVVTQADGAEFDADAFPVSGPCTVSR